MSFNTGTMQCPKCNLDNIVKNGCTHYGKQRFKCQNCGRQFVESPTRQPIDNSTRELIDKLLLERLSLRAIARVTGVSLRWLQYYVNLKDYQVPKSIEVIKKKPGRLIIQIDEMWSYVGSKENNAAHPCITPILLYSYPEAQALTGLSKDVLRDAIQEGRLKAKVIGRSWRVKRSDLDEYVATLF